MAENQEAPVSMADFLGGETAVSVVANEPQTVSLNSFSLGQTDPMPETPVIPDKAPFMKALGMKFYAGALRGTSSFNELIGMAVQPMGPIVQDWWNQTLVEPGRQKADELTASIDQDNFAANMAGQFAESLGSMGVTLPVDILAGGATKALLAGQILPKVEAIVSRIPDFALGSGWRGLLEGVQQSDNILENMASGVLKAGENISLNTLYASAGPGMSGMLKLAALGGAEATYNAAKDGRVVSKDELASGLAQGLAFGLVFAILPGIREATQIRSERRVLAEYETQLRDHVLADRFSADGSGKGSVQETMAALLADSRIRPEIKDAVSVPLHNPLNTSKGEIIPPDLKLGTWKDKNALLLNRETLERNLEKVAGADADSVKAFVTEKIKLNETYRAEWLTKTRTMVREEMTRFGVKYNSKEDKLVQKFGEKLITLEDLKTQAPENWGQIVAASKFFREHYDQMLDTINSVRENFEYDKIQKREDYFRHYQELGDLFDNWGFASKLPKTPDTVRAGIPDKTKPGKPFTSTELQRKGEKTKESAIGGIDNYLNSVSKQIFHTDSVQRVRALEQYIRMQAAAGEKVELANFVSNLREYGDLLSGKQSKFDEAFEGTFGRPLYGLLRWMKTRTSSNMIAGNISSALTNFIPFTQAMATTEPRAALKGLVKGLLSPFEKSLYTIDGVKSEFIVRRYPGGELNISMSAVERTLDIPFLKVDQFAVRSILAGKYYEMLGKGMEKSAAMKEADNYTERLVADRSWGQLPILMQAQSLGIFTQFQTEINNMMSFLAHDIPQQYKGDMKKIIMAGVQFSVYSYIFNEMYEKITGRRPTIDPIYVLATAAGVSKAGRDRGLGERLTAAGKDLVGNIPFGNIIMDGGRFPISAGIPNVWKMVGDPSKYFWSEVFKPLAFLAMPFGGSQLKKSIEGLSEYAKGESVTPAGDTRYGVEQDFSNFMRAFLFGRSAFPEAVQYWNGPKDER